MTVGELVRQTARRFAAARLHYGHGTDNAHDEAAYLVMRALGLPFHADAGIALAARDARRVESLIRRRIAERIPVAYLLHEAWLDGLPFYVDRRVIVPRSHIAALLKEKFIARPAVRRVLDLCTGSGCLAILAARTLPRAQIDAVDISKAALAVAERNLARYRLRGRIELVRSDLFAALRGRRYDLIVANPPYVSAAAMRRLPAEYRHEPSLALAAGRDGLDVVAAILSAAPDHLATGGALVCEVGENRAALRRRYPRLSLSWPQDEVFIYRMPRTGGASRTLPTLAAAS